MVLKNLSNFVKRRLTFDAFVKRRQTFDKVHYVDAVNVHYGPNLSNYVKRQNISKILTILDLTKCSKFVKMLTLFEFLTHTLCDGVVTRPWFFFSTAIA